MARGVRLVVGPQTWRDYFRFAIERNPWDLVVSQYYWRYRHEEAPPFDEFVRRPVVASWPTRTPGSTGCAATSRVDRVLRFESLATDPRGPWADRGLPGSPELPHAKSHSRPARSYRELYTDETGSWSARSSPASCETSATRSDLGAAGGGPTTGQRRTRGSLPDPTGAQRGVDTRTWATYTRTHVRLGGRSLIHGSTSMRWICR